MEQTTSANDRALKQIFNKAILSARRMEYRVNSRAAWLNGKVIPMDIIQAKELLNEDLPFQTTVDTADRIIKGLGLNKNAMILDVGTGAGNMAVTLALNGYRVITGEPEDDESLYSKKDWAGKAEKLQVYHLITFRAFNAGNMPFENETFDAVFLFGCFHHMPEAVRSDAISECRRVTTPSGVICIFEPTEAMVKYIRKSDPDHPDTADPGKYTTGMNVSIEIKNGDLFTGYILRKQQP